jgi:hypothetical protein
MGLGGGGGEGDRSLIYMGGGWATASYMRGGDRRKLHTYQTQLAHGHQRQDQRERGAGRKVGEMKGRVRKGQRQT